MGINVDSWAGMATYGTALALVTWAPILLILGSFVW